MISPSPAPPSLAQMFQKTLLAMAAVALALISWRLLDLLLLVFASALAAIMFHGLTVVLQRWLRLPFGAALTVAVLVPLIAVLVIFGLFGNLMVAQFMALATQWPAALAAIKAWLGGTQTGREIIAGLDGYAPEVGTVVGFAQSMLANLGSGVSGLAVVLVGGIYLAAQPQLYVEGVIRLAERAGLSRTRQTLAAIHTALMAWLKGQAVGMAFVAIGTGIGLSLVGLPSAIAIGLVAGLCEFVPYLGVILVSVPAVVIGFGMGIQTGILTIVALVVVQQLQGNLVTPMAQGKFSDLPPALTIFSLIGAAVLMGALGAVLAVPLTVVGVVLLKASLPPKPRAA